MDATAFVQIGIAVAAFLCGLGGGLVLRQPDRRLKTRIAVLEVQLQETQRSYEAHRARVEKHFERTSELFRDLTEQYTGLYTHLAEGARNLCPDGGPALGRGLNDPLLAATFGARGAEGEAGREAGQESAGAPASEEGEEEEPQADEPVGPEPDEPLRPEAEPKL